MASDAAAVCTHFWRDLLDVFGSAGANHTQASSSQAIAAAPGELGLARILQALAYAELGVRCDPAPAQLVNISRSLAVVEATGTNVFTAELHRLRGVTLLRLAAQQTPASELKASLEHEAEISLCIAVDLAHVQQLPLWELRATITLCRYYQQVGRREAMPLLSAVCARFPPNDPPPDITESLHLLHSLGAPIASNFTELVPG